MSFVIYKELYHTLFYLTLTTASWGGRWGIDISFQLWIESAEMSEMEKMCRKVLGSVIAVIPEGRWEQGWMGRSRAAPQSWQKPSRACRMLWGLAGPSELSWVGAWEPGLDTFLLAHLWMRLPWEGMWPWLRWLSSSERQFPEGWWLSALLGAGKECSRHEELGGLPQWLSR